MEIINKDDIKKILVFQTAFLGDVVLSTPIFKNIKEHFNNAHVTALVIPSNKPVLSRNPYIDSIITYDKKGKKKIKNFFSTLSLIKKERFDIIFSLHRSHKTALMVYLSNAPRRICFSDSGFSFLYNKRVKRDLSLHDVKRNLSILTGAGIEEVGLSDELLVTYSSKEKESLLGKIKKNGGTAKKPIIVVSPGSVWATKRYPFDSYAKVINMLKREDKYDIVITGTKDDAKTVGEIMRLCNGAAINLSGKTSLKELAALLDIASLMITNDSGPMHIAAAFNTPVVAIFGPTTRELGFYPYNKNSKVIEKDLSCRPCGKHGGNKCKIETFDCMKMIKPEEVFKAAMDLLKKSGK